jgi:SAM-dependent methyltransferase
MKNSDVGENFAKVSANPQSEITKSIYEAHNSTISNAIIRKFQGQETLVCAELGGGAGALVKEIKKLLASKKVIFTNIDYSSELLEKDVYSDHKIVSRIEDVDPIKVGKFDVVLIRYVLNYNNLETQVKIIEKAKNLLKPSGIFILHHVGARDNKHKDLLNNLFSTEAVSKKLIRGQPNWLTWEETISLLLSAGLKDKVIDRYENSLGFIIQRTLQPY